MPNPVLLTAYASPVTLIASASLNSLAGNGAYATSGATLLDNSTNQRMFMDIELVLNTVTAANVGTNGRVDVYLIPAPNGTTAATPPGASAAAPPPDYCVGRIPGVSGSTFTSGTLRGVELPPGKYAVLIQQNFGTGANFPASGNTLIGYQYGVQGGP